MEELSKELLSIQEPLNSGRGVNAARDVALYLRRGDLENAKALCFSESDKLGGYPTIKKFIVEKIFAKGEKHPWQLFG